MVFPTGGNSLAELMTVATIVCLGNADTFLRRNERRGTLKRLGCWKARARTDRAGEEIAVAQAEMDAL